ncbi:PREDICTED: sulfate transporter 3.1-like isoform X2 [Brassica oleracea var. oleracea]|uniref:sulfate transporter 3.1-like isoform X2 n=1 Tax=Brassica oleracea var. oleracea TaxID=109376 RepID=UPI0006A7478A|nr:PREDICTED: sulfate transporter 3.1-like isoform X2 [Brassica oleracea var. oleracea]
MGTEDNTFPQGAEEPHRRHHAVEAPEPQPFLKSLQYSVKETLFPDDPFRQFKNQTTSRQVVLGLKYFLPILEWAPLYNFKLFKSDLIAGITIASLAIPQGISYAKLANLPPILGLYSSFVPPLVYAVLGSSKDLAVGTVAVGSLLTGAMLSKEVDAEKDPKLYLHLAFTATFFAGVLEASLGIFRLGFIVDFLSHATIVGFMGGAATVVSLQQLKGIFGLKHFTEATDVISVMRSVFSQTHQWRWESGVLGCCFLFFLLSTRYFSTKKPKFFWVAAMAPLTSVILGSLLVYFTHAERHGVQVEGIAVGRSFAMFKNYNIDGNKEMIAFGMMNIVGSFTSCYLTTGPFSRSAVNFNAGCKTAVSNIVMAIAVMFTLLFLTPFFYYTPLVVLSSIIMVAMLGLIDYQAAIHLWKVDKFDFLVCMSAYFGVVFGSVEIGLVVAVVISIARLLLFVSRPRTAVKGNIPNTMIYRNTDQYPYSRIVPGLLILEIDAPIYFANAGYLRERITRWVDEEEDRIKASGGNSLQYVILDMSAVGNIDTSGISMMEEIKKIMDRRELKLVLANPKGEVVKKLTRSKFIGENLGKEWMFLTVGEAVEACSFMLHTSKTEPASKEEPWNNV